MNLLNNIKEDIAMYAETISQVINADVEVMNKELVRIAGTGVIKSKVGKSMAGESHTYRKVLKSGEITIITNPREEEICRDCPFIKDCKEVLEVSAPIVFDSDILGVIGLVYFNEEHKSEFLKKKNYYIKFIQQISNLITSRLFQEAEKSIIENNNKLLLNIIDRIPDGIIITNKNNNIELINEKGTSLFNGYNPESKVEASIPFEILDKKEFSIKYNSVYHDVVGDIIDFPTNMGRFRTLYVFQEADKFRTYLNKFNNSFAKNFMFTSPEMNLVYSKIQKVAKTTTTALITGESGTGKEVAARAIHMNSNRKDKPFIAVNCGAIPESLIESEFFGYVKGAFTGANPNGKIGFFEQADKGTIFLDEIGDMPLSLQVKLLRVLQEKTISPIGSNKTREIDIRIIAATNKNLEELVKENKFREDLYYRLNVFPIDIPPLRKRPKDIEELADYFVIKYSNLFNIPLKKISKEVMEAFLAYSWPGNIRELKNIIEYIINVVEEKDTFITLKHLPSKFINSSSNREVKTLAELEKEAIQNLLERFGSSSKGKAETAKALDIGLATLYRKIKQYNL